MFAGELYQPPDTERMVNSQVDADGVLGLWAFGTDVAEAR